MEGSWHAWYKKLVGTFTMCCISGIVIVELGGRPCSRMSL